MAGAKKSFAVGKLVRRKKIQTGVRMKTAAAVPTPQAHATIPKPFSIVGLGASAGGLEALEKFLSHVPPDSGIAYVVVTHLHDEQLQTAAEVLRRQETGARGMILLAFGQMGDGGTPEKSARRRWKAVTP